MSYGVPSDQSISYKNNKHTKPISDAIVLFSEGITVSQNDFTTEHVEHCANTEVCRRIGRHWRATCHFDTLWYLLQRALGRLHEVWKKLYVGIYRLLGF